MSGAAPDHGGDLAWAVARFGTRSDGWLDLSTGINPLPYPVPPLSPEIWRRLPQAKDHAALVGAAARAYGVADPRTIAAAAGSQAILQILPRLLPRGRVAILAPTYGEYVPCWQAAGHDTTLIHELTDCGEATTVILANPNNPDGRRLAPDDLLALADRLAARGGWLIVDEAFADATPEISLARHAGRDGLVVLRSFGKFFGLAGLRLGFALTPPSLAERLREALGPWTVSGPALTIGAQALNDSAWIGWTRDRLRHEAARLESLLKQSGLTILGGTAQFCLTSHPKAAAILDDLARRGILARAFADQPSWLRFGLPPAPGLARLAAALAGWRAAA